MIVGKITLENVDHELDICLIHFFSAGRIKSRPFMSNLISIPFLNFLAIVKDKVESSHNRPQIKDNILFCQIS